MRKPEHTAVFMPRANEQDYIRVGITEGIESAGFEVKDAKELDDQEEGAEAVE